MIESRTKVLAVITARGGSKGLTRKNILDLAGSPLIAWTIKAAKESKFISKVILSSDDEEIIEVAKRYDCEVPFKRPSYLATDNATSVDVLNHAIEYCPGYDFVILLQPTSPLRTAKQIDDACKLYERSLADTLVSVMFFPKFCMDGKLMSVRAGYLVPPPPPRMPLDQGKTLVRNGPAILIEKFERLRDEKTLYGAKTIPFLMDFKSSIDIDDGDDFWLAEAIFEKNKS